MKTITVHRAGDVGKIIVIKPVTIVIGDSIEKMLPSDLGDWQRLTDKEGIAVAQALIDTLPQAVLERVLCRLLAARASAYMGRLGT